MPSHHVAVARLALLDAVQLGLDQLCTSLLGRLRVFVVGEYRRERVDDFLKEVFVFVVRSRRELVRLAAVRDAAVFYASLTAGIVGLSGQRQIESPNQIANSNNDDFFVDERAAADDASFSRAAMLDPLRLCVWLWRSTWL